MPSVEEVPVTFQLRQATREALILVEPIDELVDDEAPTEVLEPWADTLRDDSLVRFFRRSDLGGDT